MNKLQAGANVVINNSESIEAVINWLPQELAMDVCAFVLDDTGKVRSDNDFIRHNKANTNDAFISLLAAKGESSFFIRLPKIPQDVNKIIFAVSSRQSLLSLFDLNIEIDNSAVFSPVLESMQSLILGELYRHNQQWKFRAVGQGFKQGLAFLADRYGVVINDDEIPQIISPEPTPSAHIEPLNGFDACIKMIKDLSKAWIFYSLAAFIAAELFLGGVVGKLIIGRFIPHTLTYTIEVILILTSFFIGGAIIGLLSSKVRVLEPALGAFLCVLLTLSISFFSPYSFMRFTWIKLFIGGGSAFFLALSGAYLAEKISAKMGNRNAQEFFGDG
ncbi:MAG: TerD family protein [Gammaproteobacteria bacterium]